MSAQGRSGAPLTEGLAVLTVLVVAALEAWLVLRVVAEPEAALSILPLHGLVALGLLLAAFGMRGSVTERPHFVLFVVATVFLGPFGVVGAAGAALLSRAHAWRATPFEEWYRALFPEERRDRTRELYEKVVLRGHGPAERSTVAPFADVISLGSLQEKQAAIALIASHFRPEFAVALRAALNDQEAAVRVQAAAAVARIEQQFLRRSIALEARRAADSSDPTLLMELAGHYGALSATGLVDETRAREAAESALALYIDVRDRTEDEAVRVAAAGAAGRLLLRLGRTDEAERLLAPTATSDRATPDVVAPYLEALFRLRRFVDLRQLCIRLRDAGSEGLPEGVEDALALWTEDAPQPMLPAHTA